MTPSLHRCLCLTPPLRHQHRPITPRRPRDNFIATTLLYLAKVDQPRRPRCYCTFWGVLARLQLQHRQQPSANPKTPVRQRSGPARADLRIAFPVVTGSVDDAVHDDRCEFFLPLLSFAQKVVRDLSEARSVPCGVAKCVASILSRRQSGVRPRDAPPLSFSPLISDGCARKGMFLHRCRACDLPRSAS